MRAGSPQHSNPTTANQGYQSQVVPFLTAIRQWRSGTPAAAKVVPFLTATNKQSGEP
jgi:hypothetical protein